MVKSKPKIWILIPIKLHAFLLPRTHRKNISRLPDPFQSDLYNDIINRGTVDLEQAECITLHNLFLFFRNRVFKTEVWIGMKTSGPQAFKTTYKEETLLNDTSLLVFSHVYKGTLPLFKPQIMHNSWAHELWSAVDKKTQLCLPQSAFTGFPSVLLISSITVILATEESFFHACFCIFLFSHFLST